MTAPTHIYTGSSGYVFALPDGPVQLDNGAEVTLTDALAAKLGAEFEPIGGTVVDGTIEDRPGPGAQLPPYDPADPGPHVSDPALDVLDKAALLALADEHGIDVNRRLGEPKLRQVIADALHTGNDQQGDEPGA